MKVHLKIMHLPSHTEWVTKAMPATKENLDELSELCTHVAQGNLTYGCFDISDHTQAYMNEKTLSECVLTTVIIDDVINKII
jgi:predicted nucleotidyltransferase